MRIFPVIELARYAALVAALVVAGTPAHALDPRCSNRAATGIIACVIDRPNVTQHETVYPSVQFAPGDIVEVQADGCVQTGGWGPTWKRYINPAGPDSDRLYHGLVRIPSALPAGSGLIRIESVVGHRQRITGTGLTLSQLVLHLGYEDDGYGDNGYTSHDDGNQDQCKNDRGHGGPARVAVTIFRGVAPYPVASRFDFDVLSDTVDVNMIPYNPSWAWQRRAGNGGNVPDTATCHYFSFRDTHAAFPDLHLSPSFPDCTDQTDPGHADQPGGFNGIVCRDAANFVSNAFAGHTNWFRVTLEGQAWWGGEETDDDNSFTFVSDQPGNPLGVVGHTTLHVEFDSDETTKLFASQEWVDFHGFVRSGSDDAARQHFNGHTIITGMFGLDGEHNLKSELHPLYAMATRRDDFGNDSTHEDWLIFVRNRGDEGYCSSRLWDAGFENYTFRLPWLKDMSAVKVVSDDKSFEGTAGTSGPFVAALPPPSRDAGVYVTFHLGPAANTPFIDGSLKLAWTVATRPPVGTTHLSGVATAHTPVAVAHVPPSGTVVTANGSKNSGEENGETDEAEHRLAAAEAHLAPVQRQAVARAATVVRPAVHFLPRVVEVRKITARPSVAGVKGSGAIDAGPATAKLQRDLARIRALCAASHNAPAGFPAGVCSAAAASQH